MPRYGANEYRHNPDISESAHVHIRDIRFDRPPSHDCAGYIIKLRDRTAREFASLWALSGYTIAARRSSDTVKLQQHFRQRLERQYHAHPWSLAFR
jgi:hypothetical protein